MNFGCTQRWVSAIGLVILFLSGGYAPAADRDKAEKSDKAASPPKIQVDTKPISKDTKLATSYAGVVKKVAPSVVNINTSKTLKESPRNPFEDPIFRYFFGDEFNAPNRRSPRQERSLGSGVIVTPDGYILSNNHVVEGADEVKVTFASGQKTHIAKVVGSDPQTDIAVLKIEGTNLPAVTITDNDTLEVGDVVMAVGNPFGVGQSVTVGIVSAVGRGGIGITDYEDFIQTDASINPGNSGGALIDAEGRLVGINTAILSRTGGNMGIGFAVPVNMARFVMDQIITRGKVVRGFLGVMIQPLDEDLAREFNLPGETGALVGEVTANSPAAEAGLKEGDVIVEFNGKKVTDSRHLRLMVAQTAPKTKVNVRAVREGKEKTFTLTLGELPSELARADRREDSSGGGQDVLEGVTVDDIDPQARRQFEIPSQVKGAIVTEVDPGSAAAAAGLRPGDVIVEIGRQPVRDADEAVKLSKAVKTPRVLLRVWSKGGTRYVLVDSGKGRKE